MHLLYLFSLDLFWLDFFCCLWFRIFILLFWLVGSARSLVWSTLFYFALICFVLLLFWLFSFYLLICCPNMILLCWFLTLSDNFACFVWHCLLCFDLILLASDLFSVVVLLWLFCFGCRLTDLMAWWPAVRLEVSWFAVLTVVCLTR